MDFRINNEKGMSLVELMISIGLSFLLATLGTAFLTQINQGSSLMQARRTAKQDNLNFLAQIRSGFYLSIPDKLAPAMFSQITNFKSPDANGYTRVGVQVNLVNSGSTNTFLMAISTKCVPAPNNLMNTIPVMNSVYIASILNDVNCVSQLNGLSCNQNQIPIAEIQKFNTTKVSALPAGILVGNKIYGARMDRAIAAIACVVPNTATGYTTLKIWSGIYNAQNSHAANLANRLRWYKNEMILAPFSTGNASYLQN